MDPNQLSADKLLLVGKVIKPHGVRGEVLVKSFTDLPEIRFQPNEKFSTTLSHLPTVTLIQARRVTTDKYVCSFEEITNRNQAEQWGKFSLLINREKSKSKATEKDNFFVNDLIGLQVINTERELLGTVEEIVASPAHDIITVVKGHKKFPIPFVKALVLEVDLVAGKILVDLPAGLTEL